MASIGLALCGSPTCCSLCWVDPFGIGQATPNLHQSAWRCVGVPPAAACVGLTFLILVR